MHTLTEQPTFSFWTAREYPQPSEQSRQPAITWPSSNSAVSSRDKTTHSPLAWHDSAKTPRSFFAVSVIFRYGTIVREMAHIMTANTIAATLRHREITEKIAKNRNRDSCDSFNSVWTLNSFAVACNCSKALATTSPMRSKSSSSFLILSSGAPLLGRDRRSPSVATIPLADAISGVSALMIGMIWIAILYFFRTTFL